MESFHINYLFFSFESLPQPHYGSQDFSPLAIGHFIEMIKKTPLRNGNSPIMDLVTEMGVAHTFSVKDPTQKIIC